MSATHESFDIQTPENVSFGYQVAGIGSRFIATLIDTLLIFLLQFVVFIVALLILNALGDALPRKELFGWVLAIFGVISFLFLWGYYILFEMLWNGQSPGKRRVGLRVIRADGTPITISESFIRNLVRIVDLLPAAYGIGIVTMFIDKQSRRLGDLAAGTLVVYDRAPITIQELSVKRTVNLRPWALEKISLDGFPIERLTNDDLNLIEDFLSRREQLTHREALAVQILSTLHTRLGLPQPATSRFEAEDILSAILLEVQKRQANE